MISEILLGSIGVSLDFTTANYDFYEFGSASIKDLRSLPLSLSVYRHPKGLVEGFKKFMDLIGS